MKKDNKFLFSKTIINLDLLRRDSINRLFKYINTNDVELDKVKILIKRANIDLRPNGKQLFIRRPTDKDDNNRICITRR
jgi:hypothetical protein